MRLRSNGPPDPQDPPDPSSSQTIQTTQNQVHTTPRTDTTIPTTTTVDEQSTTTNVTNHSFNESTFHLPSDTHTQPTPSPPASTIYHGIYSTTNIKNQNLIQHSDTSIAKLSQSTPSNPTNISVKLPTNPYIKSKPSKPIDTYKHPNNSPPPTNTIFQYLQTKLPPLKQPLSPIPTKPNPTPISTTRPRQPSPQYSSNTKPRNPSPQYSSSDSNSDNELIIFPHQRFATTYQPNYNYQQSRFQTLYNESSHPNQNNTPDYLQQLNFSLQQQNLHLNQKILNTKSKYRTRIRDLEHQNMEHHRNLTELSIEHSHVQQESTSLKEQNSTLSIQLHQAHHSIDIYVDEIDNLKQKISNFETDTSFLRRTLVERTTNVNTLEHEIKNLTNIINKHSADRDDELQQLYSTVDASKKLYLTLEDTCTSNIQQINDLQTEILELQEKIETLEIEVQTKNEIIDCLNDNQLVPSESSDSDCSYSQQSFVNVTHLNRKHKKRNQTKGQLKTIPQEPATQSPPPATAIPSPPSVPPPTSTQSQPVSTSSTSTARPPSTVHMSTYPSPSDDLSTSQQSNTSNLIQTAISPILEMMQRQEAAREARRREEWELDRQDRLEAETRARAMKEQDIIRTGPKHNRFPMFTEDKFDDWYLGVTAILALEEWSPLFDPSTKTIVPTTTSSNKEMSNHLYNALVTATSKNVTLSNASLYPELRGNGPEFLQYILTTFKLKWTDSTKHTKLQHFYNIKRSIDETIAAFTGRFRRAIFDLAYNGITIDPESAKNLYILALGPQFTTIQNFPTLRPPEWHTDDIMALSRAAAVYLETITATREFHKVPKPTPVVTPTDGAKKPEDTKQYDPKKDPKNKDKNQPQHQLDIKKAIGQGLFTTQYINNMQSTCPGLCIWHRGDQKYPCPGTYNCVIIAKIISTTAQYNPTSAATNQYTYRAPGGSPNPPSGPTNPPPTQPPIARRIHTSSCPVDDRLASNQFDLLDFESDNSVDDNTNNEELSDYLDLPNTIVRRFPPLPPIPEITSREPTHIMSPSIINPKALKNLLSTEPKNIQPSYKQILQSLPPLPSQPHTWVIDTGATSHMCHQREYFISFTTNTQKHVYLGDSQTTAPVLGCGTIQMVVNGNTIRLHNVLYVPSLSISIFSIKVHFTYQGCIQTCSNCECILTFPSFTITAHNGDEIIIHSRPSPPTAPPDFDSTNATLVNNPQHSSQTIQVNNTPYNVKIHSKYFQIDPTLRPAQSSPDAVGYDLKSPITTTIPPQSRKAIPLGFSIEIPRGLYGRIAPRSGLALNSNIDIAAGVIDPDYRGEVRALLVNNSQKAFHITAGQKICQLIFEKVALPKLQFVSTLTKTFRDKGGFGSTDLETIISRYLSVIDFDQNTIAAYPPLVVPPPPPLPPLPSIIDFDDNSSIPTDEPTTLPTQLLAPPDTKTENPLTISQSPYKPLVIPPSHKAMSTSRNTININADSIKKAIGFLNLDNILPHLRDTFQPNFHLSSTPSEPILDLGDVATIDKSKRSQKQVTLPSRCGEVLHADIVFGSKSGIGGIRYALLLVDRATRYTFVIPLRNLTDDIQTGLSTLFATYKFTPEKIVTDYDHKLMGKDIRTYLSTIHCSIESAPPRHQQQNGLVERRWKTIVRMARSWLNQHLLPSEFWYHAILRASEVLNYLPIKSRGIITSPFELTHDCKPDIRNLLPLFSLAYIDKPRENTHTQEQFQQQNLRCILIGKSDKANCLRFYHPPTKQTYDSADYRLDPTLASGPALGLRYDGGLFTSHYDEYSDSHRPPHFDTDDTVYYRANPEVPYTQAKILTIPITDDIYTVMNTENSQVVQMPFHRLLPSDPTIEPTNDPNNSLRTLPSWITHDCPVTIFLDTMKTPRRGSLHYSIDTKEWYFHPGRSVKNTPIHLVKFEEIALSLIQSRQLFKGHIDFNSVYLQRRNIILRRTVVQHISAANLRSMDTPTLLSLHKFDKGDQEIWNAGYDEEYNGLTAINTWTVIDEEKYQQLRKIHGNAIPSMAISTIKYDENGSPKRAKWRIVALGNLDPHNWSIPDCYAPVLSQYELRWFCSLSIHHQRRCKNLDVKQAFVQATIPEDEVTIIKPPPGCTKSLPNTYWLLKRTLYGLKRSPRHWFLTITKSLQSIGLRPLPSNPCLFVGSFLGSRIYVGVYVDDIIYFGETDECEQEFQRQLGAIYTCDFMGSVSHFLGIKFSYFTKDNNLCLHLSQQAFTENLVSAYNLDTSNSVPTPFRHGHPIDTLPMSNHTIIEQKIIKQQLQEMVGSLTWLAQSTRPDIATTVNLLAQHISNPNKQHISSAKYIIRYLNSTKSRGIQYSPITTSKLSSFVTFPIPNKTLILSDANWGPQDQSAPKPNKPISEHALFTVRSMSGYIIFTNGPIHWQARRQKVTARSSAEAEIYATDECLKFLLHLHKLITESDTNNIFCDTSKPYTIYNDNMACVQWSKNTTSKGLRHIMIRENGIRESIQADFIDVLHIEGKVNIADLFTKEHKDIAHFITLRDIVTVECPFTIQTSKSKLVPVPT